METFASLSNPGHHYLKRVLRGAYLWQRCWSHYWHSTSEYRCKKITLIQALWRKYYNHKKYQPLIRMRLKMSKRLRIITAMHKWRSYVHMCIRMKAHIRGWLEYQRFEGNYFLDWKHSVQHILRSRELVLQPVHQRQQSKMKTALFRHWKNYVFQIENINRMKLTISRYPHFYMWKQRIKEKKRHVYLNKAVQVIQRFFRLQHTNIVFLRNQNIRMRVRQFTNISKSNNNYTSQVISSSST
jgi:hypothetical protein